MDALQASLLTVADLIPNAKGERPLTIGPMHLGPGLLPLAGAICKSAGLSGRALVGMDANTRRVAGDAVVASLREAGYPVVPLLLGPPDGARFLASSRLSRQLLADGGATPDFFVAVGAGTITDIVKYAAYLVERPFVAVATAASVDAYTSSLAAMVDDEVKKSLPCNAPAAVIADMEVITAAPLDLTRAGFGDTLAKFTSCADWVVAHDLLGEAYRREVAAATCASARELLDRAGAVAAREPRAMHLLMRGQLALGIAMWMAESSRPASGAEHLVSHCWDMQALRQERLPAYHGYQVAVGTAQMARLYELFDRMMADRQEPEPLEEAIPRLARERAAALAELGCDGDEVGKAWPDAEPLEHFRESVRMSWPDTRQKAGEFLVPGFELEGAYRRCGCPTQAAEIGVDAPTARRTFLVARYLRSRFTILDLFDAFRPLASVVDAVVQ